MDTSEVLTDVVVALATSIVMIKVTSWLSKKGRIKFWTVGKSRVGDGSVIKGGWFSSAIVALAKWITSTPD